MQSIEVQTLETILATLDEVIVTLMKKRAIVKSNKGSWLMRSAGILDAIAIVSDIRERIVQNIVEAKGVAAPLPAGLTVLSPEEVAARESHREIPWTNEVAGGGLLNDQGQEIDVRTHGDV